VLNPALADVADDIRRQVERDALYANYIARQQRDIDLLQKDEAHIIPSDFDYRVIDGLSNELTSKLENTAPTNLAQAARIDGMTPAALTLILSHLKRGSRKKSA
jgi:tRNA uridine 5-carboxymethylaminomethyl modification enzyme